MSFEFRKEGYYSCDSRGILKNLLLTACIPIYTPSYRLFAHSFIRSFDCSFIRLFGCSFMRIIFFRLFVFVFFFGYLCSFIPLFVAAVQLGMVLTVQLKSFMHEGDVVECVLKLVKQ